MNMEVTWSVLIKGKAPQNQNADVVNLAYVVMGGRRKGNKNSHVKVWNQAGVNVDAIQG